MSVVLALAVAVGALVAQPPEARPLRVVAVPGLGLDSLESLARRGAVGLVVPGAGPTVSEEAAVRTLARGRVRNSLRGGVPSGPDLVPVEVAAAPPAGDRVIVVGVPRGGRQRNDQRYPIAVIAPGYDGLLLSRSTKIPGLVSARDVTLTALGADGRLRAREAGDAPGELRDLDGRIRDNSRSRLPVTLLAAAAVAAAALARPRSALAVLLAVLVANLGLGLAGAAAPVAVLLTVAVACAGAAIAGEGAGHESRRPGLICLAVVAAYLVALAWFPTALALSPMGPTQNSRFYGLSNVLETILLAPAFVAAASLAARTGLRGFALAAAVALPTFAWSRAGADGGGAIVFAVGLSVLAVEHWEKRRLILALVLPVAAAVVLGLIKLDEATGGKSHVVGALKGGERGIIADLVGRAQLSYERATVAWYVIVPTLVAVVVLALAHRALLRTGASRRTRAVPTCLGVATLASLVVNDSPPEVAILGVLGYLAVAAPVLWQRRAAPPVSRSAGRALVTRTKRPGRRAVTRVVPAGPRLTQAAPDSTAQ